MTSIRCRLSGLVIIGTLLSCVMATSAFAEGDSRQETRRTVVAASSTALLIWLAQDLGYLDDLSLDVVRMPSGINTGPAVVDGTADLATSSGFGFTARALERDDLRLVATMSSLRSAKLIARLPHSTPGSEQLPELRNLRYAVTENSISHYFLSQYLALHGLEISDVDLSFMPPDDIVAAMENRTIDAALTWEPYVARIERVLGRDTVYFDDQLGQFFYFCLYGTKDWIDQNSAVLGEFPKAIMKAEDFAGSNPDESMDRLAVRLDIDRAVLADIWRIQSRRLQLPLAMPSVLELAVEWRMNEGLTSQTTIPNVLDFIDTRPLGAVSPNSVHMFR